MSRFYWIGNNLAFDFANTLAVDENGRPAELLATFDDLLAWVVESGLAPQSAAERVRNMLNAEQQKVNAQQQKVNTVFRDRIQQIFDSAIRRGLAQRLM